MFYRYLTSVQNKMKIYLMGRHLATIRFILKLEFDNNLLMIISLKLTGSLAWVLNSVIEETSFKTSC